MPAAHATFDRHGAPVDSFAAPTGELVLTRVVRRALPDGKEIVTRRRYAVRFISDDAGFRVEGRLLGVEVEAPARLAALAQLERARSDEGLFPMRLDPRGMIAGASRSAGGEPRDSAGQLAAGMIAGSQLAGDDRRDAEHFVAQVQGNGAIGRWPDDLFRPAPGRRSDRQRMPLDAGREGAVTVTTEARASAGSGLLEMFERTVATEAGGQLRITRETWTLEPETPRP